MKVLYKITMGACLYLLLWASSGKADMIINGQVIDVVKGNVVVLVTDKNIKASDKITLQVELYGVSVPDVNIYRAGDQMIFDVEPYADEAYMYFANNILGQDVSVKVLTVTDKCEHLVGIMYKDEVNINLEILTNGLGKFNGEYIEAEDVFLYKEREQQAKLDGIGLWRESMNDSEFSFKGEKIGEE